MSNLDIESSSLVTASTKFIGEFKVIIGKRCIIHPKVVIDSRKGPITIGDENIIEERCEIVSPEGGIVIGSLNQFRVCSKVRCREIGNLNIFEIRSDCFSDVIVLPPRIRTPSE